MTRDVDRRRVIQASLGVAAAAGLGAAGAAGAPPAPARAGAGLRAPHLPPVPGMRGDRYANEFWNEFDNATLFQQSPAVRDAFVAIEEYLATSPPPPRSIIVRWQEMQQSTGYPDNFIAYMAPVTGPLGVLSGAQATVFDAFFRPHDPRLVPAFADFAQGVLYDPRHTPPVHTMGSEPPVGYHVWHIFMRAMMFLGIDPERWHRIAPINGFAWAVQSIAKPVQTEVNPPLPNKTVRELARGWLRRDLDELDTAFLSFPYPEGIS
jgi:hypothetical protein